MVVVDYLKEFKLGRQDVDKVLFEICQQLRSFAVRHDCAVITGMQLNREGMRSSNPDALHVGDSIGILQVSDFMLTIRNVHGVEGTEKGRGGIRHLFVDKGRDERRGFEVAVTQCYGMSQFARESVWLMGTTNVH